MLESVNTVGGRRSLGGVERLKFMPGLSDKKHD